jgi:hypothetical protein
LLTSKTILGDRFVDDEFQEHNNFARVNLGNLYESTPPRYHMQLITHRSHLDALPESSLKAHIKKRFDEITDESNDEVLPTAVLVNEGDNIAGPDYFFVGNQGLLSDLFEEHEPGHPEFARPFEWASYLPELNIYEVLLLIHGEDGVFIYVPDSIVEANTKLHWILTDENQGGLSPAQPL